MFCISEAWVTAHKCWPLEEWLALDFIHNLLDWPIKDGVNPFKQPGA